MADGNPTPQDAEKTVKGWVTTAMDEWLEKTKKDNAPPPKRTDSNRDTDPPGTPSVFESLFGISGK